MGAGLGIRHSLRPLFCRGTSCKTRMHSRRGNAEMCVGERRYFRFGSRRPKHERRDPYAAADMRHKESRRTSRDTEAFRVREDDGVVVLFQAIHVFWHGCVPPFSIALEGPVVMGSCFRRNDGGTPTISCINIKPIPQVLGHYRAMWYPASHSLTARFDRPRFHYLIAAVEIFRP
jgi:hypothetical protein